MKKLLTYDFFNKISCPTMKRSIGTCISFDNLPISDHVIASPALLWYILKLIRAQHEDLF